MRQCEAEPHLVVDGDSIVVCGVRKFKTLVKCAMKHTTPSDGKNNNEDLVLRSRFCLNDIKLPLRGVFLPVISKRLGHDLRSPEFHCT